MDINFRGEGWTPIYFDPEPDEIIALTKSFDTLRIGFKLEKGKYYLVIASGLGNTHSTLSRALGETNPRQKVNREGLKYGGLDGTAILYEEGRRLWFNLCDFGSGEKVKPENAYKYFPESCRDTLKEIVRTAIEQQDLLP